MKVLITGKGGQLAWELEQTAPDNIELLSFDEKQLDITNQVQVNDVILAYSPDLVINAAAYTAVDKAETDQTLAYAVNQKGSEYLAIICKEIKAKLIHVSTDFIFDGEKNTPYKIMDAPNPINIYGDSKLQGEIKINEILAGDATVIRTAWVYSSHGNNFVKTMLRLMTEKDELGIVYDQIGSPTWAKGLAKLIWQLIEKPKECKKIEFAQIFHYTDAGIASWYDFAVAIQELAIEKGMLAKSIPIYPIPASSYPTPAKRPSFSVLDKSDIEIATGIKTQHWRKQLSLMLDELNISHP